MLSIKKLFFLFILTIGLSYCHTRYSSLKNKNLAYLYQNDSELINKKFKLFSPSDSVICIYFRIDAENILFSKDSETKLYKSNVILLFNCFEIDEQNYQHLAYSDSFKLKKEKEKFLIQDYYINGKINLKINANKNYIVTVKTYDKVKNIYDIDYIYINKKEKNNRNLLLLNPLTQTPIYKNWVKKNEKFLILQRSNTTHNISIKQYEKNNSFPLPPFVLKENHDYIKKIIKDTNFILPNDTFLFSLKELGIYTIENQNGILSINIVDNQYPTVSEYNNLLESLRFITNNEEYTSLINSENKKKSFDDFWLEISNNKERAKDLMLHFYERVEKSNILFTSYKSGWKTDRGLIFIIFGSPSIVYKSFDKEEWIYGNEISDNYQFYFKFTKNYQSPFTNNFILQRLPQYKNIWYQMVEQWRIGRIYN